MKILVLNSGSSSLKYQVIDTETGEMLVKGYYERIGQPHAFLTHKVNGEKHKFEHPARNHEKAIEFVIRRLTSDNLQFLILLHLFLKFELLYLLHIDVKFHGIHIFLFHIFHNIHKELDKHIFL